MDRKELIALCLTFPDAYEDYPFDDDNWTVMRHTLNRKIFAWIYKRDGNLCVNVKGEPMQLDFWRSVYKGVSPGYHMNKSHWNTVILNSDVPIPELTAMVAESHRLTRGKDKRGSAQHNAK